MITKKDCFCVILHLHHKVSVFRFFPQIFFKVANNTAKYSICIIHLLFVFTCCWSYYYCCYCYLFFSSNNQNQIIKSSLNTTSVMIVADTEIQRFWKQSGYQKNIFGIKDANCIETSRALTNKIGSLTGFLVHSKLMWLNFAEYYFKKNVFITFLIKSIPPLPPRTKHPWLDLNSTLVKAENVSFFGGVGG